MPLPDVSVRPAVLDDAPRIWEIQRHALIEDIAAAFGGAVPEAARAQIEEVDGADAWRQTIASLPAKSAVVVALRADRVVGYGSLIALPEPVATPDGHGVIHAEISGLDVRGADQRAGHGSRLLAALMDYADTFALPGIVTWAVAGEESRTRFLTSAGFAPLGMKRDLDVAGERLSQVGWYTLLPERAS